MAPSVAQEGPEGMDTAAGRGEEGLGVTHSLGALAPPRAALISTWQEPTPVHHESPADASGRRDTAPTRPRAVHEVG